MQSIEDVRQHIRQLLATTGEPELGARLKQRLNTHLLDCGGTPFHERSYGFRKFIDFLDAFPNDFELRRPTGPGDFRVRLKGAAHMDRPRVGSGAVREFPRVHNDAWQAFTNPDPARHRYVHVKTGRISHYLDRENSPFRDDVEAGASDLVEVTPVPPEDQLAWMREYLEQLPLTEGERAVLVRLAEGPYTSQLNNAFTAALRLHGMGWRRRRAARVYEHIERWALARAVPLRLLVDGAADMAPSPPDEGVRPNPTASLARERANQLIAMLSDDEVERFVLPLLLTTMWTTSHRSP